MQPRPHSTPSLVRFNLGARLKAALDSPDRKVVAEIEDSCATTISRQQVRHLCAGKVLAFGCADPREEEFYTYSASSTTAAAEAHRLSQVIESAYVSALLMIGGTIAENKGKNGVVRVMISDIERGYDNSCSFYIGFRFVTPHETTTIISP